VEMVVALNINVVKKVVLIGFVSKLGSGLGGVSARRNLSRSLALPIAITRVIGTPQMVFTNPIMTTHVNRIIDRPPMNSMTAGRYRNVDAVNPRGGHQEPSAIIAQILDHKNGHYVRPNTVAIKYLDF